ncbi:MAG TPA: helix-turn-helix domain-containing protein [Steroidobacteraceae bacterium]|nr:helix-turn-helix domain-containing protein [Steroidobacteraceae bacterium]
MDQSSATPARPANTLQTLDRGLQALALISQQERGLSIAELAAQLDVHRAIAYRLATTLESRGLIARADDGRLRLGAGLLILASRFEPQLRTLADPLLRELAETTRAAAFLSVAAGEDCVAIMVTEPEGTLLRVSYRVGSRHPLTRGAAGIAILAGRRSSPGDPEAVRLARRDGFSVTRGELQRGAVGIASAVHSPDRVSTGLEASIGVVAFEDLDVRAVKHLVTGSARRLAAALWRTQGNRDAT